MKRSTLPLILLFIGCTATLSVNAQEGRGVYTRFWEETEKIFADPEKSPLTDRDRARFDSIARYPYNPAFRYTAQWKPIEGAKPQSIETTTEAKRRMQKAGVLIFLADSLEVELPVYRDLTAARMKVTEPSYFLPFTDLTNGGETYGGGRYIDLDAASLGASETVLDFNLAYNPYCVYNPKYSCPVPPAENHVPIRIEAGARIDR